MLHVKPSAHCESCVHEMLQPEPDALHVYALQLTATGVPHVPVPLQVAALVNTPSAHDGAEHCVAGPYNWQARAPLQTPVVPQLAAGVVAHSLAGSEPEGMAVQVPTDPGTFAASQSPLQRVFEQTPSVQNPD